MVRSAPASVTAAVTLLAVSFVPALIVFAAKAHWKEPVAWLMQIVVVVLIVWFLVSIYRGKNWVRWLFIIWFGLGMFGTPRAIQYWAKYADGAFTWVAYAQILFQSSAFVLLLLPSSFRWFQSPTDSSLAPEKV
jgi:hypothetical protein